jgi:hypothetical protein
MSQQEVQSTREGGREENPDAASPSEARPRNSSGSASHAASLLDLRQKINLHSRCLQELLRLMGSSDLLRELQQEQQRGFRRNR